MKYYLQTFLQSLYLIWAGVFIGSVMRYDANPLALIMCLLCLLLWIYLKIKGGR
jgi:hypothetical protein